MARTIADGIEDHGYEAVALGSGRKALEWLTQHPCDALVTDLRMAGVDGLGLLTASRKQAPERPVIVMTAYSAVDSAIECIRQGAYHYLTKPLLLDELVPIQKASAEAGAASRERSKPRHRKPVETVRNQGDGRLDPPKAPRTDIAAPTRSRTERREPRPWPGPARSAGSRERLQAGRHHHAPHVRLEPLLAFPPALSHRQAPFEPRDQPFDSRSESV